MAVTTGIKSVHEIVPYPGLVVESSGPETATHHIGTDCGRDGKAEKNAFHITTVGAV
jgi:hypothetical protein